MKRPFPFHSNLVWPPAILVGIFIVVYGLVSACFWLIELSEMGFNAHFSELTEVIFIRGMILAIAAAIYAAFRLLRFHPACNRAYAGWLKLSPWTADRPLPAGPVHLVWQDAVVVGVLTAIGIWHHVNPLLPVTVFVFLYLAGFTLLLLLTRQWGSCLVLGFFWPTLILPSVIGMGLPTLVILVAIVCVIWYGHRQSLKAFPWEFIKIDPRFLARVDIRIQGLGTPSAAGTQYHIGWPYLMQSPKIRPPAVSHTTNLALGALAGWWSYCIIKATNMLPVSGLILVLAIIVAFGRLTVYIAGVTTPFNIWGRISTGRIVVPGFDKIFVTPLAVVIAAELGSIIINRSGEWYPVTESVLMSVLCWVLLGGGPTLRSWALTGQFRLRPPHIVNASKQMIRQV